MFYSSNKRQMQSFLAVLATALPLVLAGCPQMTNPPAVKSPTNVPLDANRTVHIDTRKPIPFDRHAFGASCFDTYGCKVLYNGRYEARDPDDVKQMSSASLGDVYPDNMTAHTIGIRNFPDFPPPAEVSWRSKDGQPHHATVDLGAIFKDKVVLHRVPQDQLPPILQAGVYPDIILEVNDRTINMYMRAFVDTAVPQRPDRPDSYFRNDLILAYTKTY